MNNIQFIFNPVTEAGQTQYGERLCSQDCQHRQDGVPVINLRLIGWIIFMKITGRPWSAHKCRLFGKLYAFQDGSRVKVKRHDACHRCEQWLVPTDYAEPAETQPEPRRDSEPRSIAPRTFGHPDLAAVIRPSLGIGAKR